MGFFSKAITAPTLTEAVNKNRLETIKKKLNLEDELKMYTYWHNHGKKGLRPRIKVLTKEIETIEIAPAMINGKTYFKADCAPAPDTATGRTVKPDDGVTITWNLQ